MNVLRFVINSVLCSAIAYLFLGTMVSSATVGDYATIKDLTPFWSHAALAISVFLGTCLAGFVEYDVFCKRHIIKDRPARRGAPASLDKEEEP